ncbi:MULTISPECIES: alpha/beta hydrolase [unclassified Nodularia (in: cyanobacteria)]|uniref:alpha/beta fold hydrolase n=1 Tax=unclassified Nodularia (in: cyanobacteria) TaxID=2656917 RepID=UPI00187FD3DB|nr:MULTISPECIES: alpha/beta hydrolase [unclassified Nodularia (in: cyanobacteria)]MBE9197559.1 alpha/beta hydrolase [Nodularia sp. LEGE 06071]MCC2693939.1 alpha/beta hydrolase [Nodularia sp. LEGE 04288]
MSDLFDVLWLNASPTLKRFDQPLLQHLSGYMRIAQWEYQQSRDEASSIDQAVLLLHDFLDSYPDAVHLGGHGISGAIALTYARRYPEKVRSLTLLAVGSQPANTWHAHYYFQRQLFSISREQVLANSVRSLFGKQPCHTAKKLMTALDKDLERSPSPHSLFKLVYLPKGGVSMPMLVCGSKTDSVVNPPALDDWRNWFKPEDRLWRSSQGYHFFHYFHPQEVGEQILNFWGCYKRRSSLAISAQPSTASIHQ